MVAANEVEAKVDRVILEKFESDLKNTLYGILNRILCDHYFLSPVSVVEIRRIATWESERIGSPASGGLIEQTVVADLIEGGGTEIPAGLRQMPSREEWIGPGWGKSGDRSGDWTVSLA